VLTAEWLTGLLDRIPLSSGGTAEMPGGWLSDRAALIAEVTAAIIAFQTVNHRPVIDGVVDPGGGTLQQMNALAGPVPIIATIVGSGSGPRMWPVADPTSLDGTRPLRRRDISPSITKSWSASTAARSNGLASSSRRTQPAKSSAARRTSFLRRRRGSTSHRASTALTTSLIRSGSILRTNTRR